MREFLLRRNVFLQVVLLYALGVFITSSAYAQFNVSGKVITSEDQSALPGVNILVKGTSTGTITDVDGNYTITANSQDDVLVFSLDGYNSQEIAIDGRNNVNVTLTSDARQLSEVVVTALGIKREDKSLGFAAQSVNENAVKRCQVEQLGEYTFRKSSRTEYTGNRRRADGFIAYYHSRRVFT